LFSQPKWSGGLGKEKTRPSGRKCEKENLKRGRDNTDGMAMIAQAMTRKNEILAQRQNAVNHDQILALISLDTTLLSTEDKEILNLMKLSVKQR
jgi:hypothetical protein